MPTVKDFEKNKGNGAPTPDLEAQIQNQEAAGKKPKRRPGRDQETQASASAPPQVKVVDVETGSTTSGTEGAPVEATATLESEAQVEINFPGSEMLRSRFPKPFNLAETIANQWVKDGNFEGLQVGHPLAQFFLAKGLRKAKDLEKTIINSPVTEKVTMQVLQAGMKAGSHIATAKEQVDQAKETAKTHVENLKKKIGR